MGFSMVEWDILISKMLFNIVNQKGEFMFQYDAIDKDGIPRVWGVGETQKEAKEQCELALQEYCEEKNRNPHLYKIVKK